jgi:penicillin-insensitive murein endopeptidase
MRIIARGLRPGRAVITAALSLALPLAPAAWADEEAAVPAVLQRLALSPGLPGADEHPPARPADVGAPPLPELDEDEAEEPVADAPDADTGDASQHEPEITPEAASAVLANEQLLLLAQTDLPAVGPLSIGTPDAGLLVNPAPFPEGPLWTIRDPSEAWATQETIDFLVAAIREVERRFPGSPRVVIGDISRPDGGRLNRHKSHQAGRDVDIGFYYERGELENFRAARARDLDVPRTWALVRALIEQTDVDRIFVDRSLIRVFYAHALEIGEDAAWLDDVFGRGERKGIIQHEKRHKDHLHVRFFNPVAQERGRVVYRVLVEAGALPPPTVRHRVRSGETLGSLARRYGTSASAIRAANGLRSSFLRAGRSYVIPIRRVPQDAGPIVVPPRRRPPSQSIATDVPQPPPAGDASALGDGGSR